MKNSDINHPITPPPELVQQWMYVNNMQIAPLYMAQAIATQAARWGADQELEGCCEWLQNAPFGLSLNKGANQLRLARRPKPPSLKEQALEAHGEEPLPETGPTGDIILNAGAIERHRLIRRALEQLDD